jgi:GT2 family glycosyltransferase
LNMAGNTWFQDIVAHARASFVGHGLDSTIYSSNFDGFVDPTSSGAVYKRSVFEGVGLYDEQFDACEDVEFNHRVRRAGLSSYLSSRLAIQYRPRSNLCALFKQLFRYGRGRFRLIRKHRDALSYSQLVPAGFVLWLLLAGLLSVASRYAAIALAVTVGAYMSVLLLAGAGLALRRGSLHFFVAPAVYATIHMGLGCGFWTEMCRSTRDLFSKSGGQSQAAGTAKPEVSQLSRGSGSQC